MRTVLLDPERLSRRNTPTKYLLSGLIYCEVCGGRMMSRPRDSHTKRYVRADRRSGHQLGTLTQPVDRYHSIRTRLEREVERLHAMVDRASKERLVLHPDCRAFCAEADSGQRRKLLRLIIERVRALPARRGARFDPSRLRVDVPLLSLVRVDRTG